jgi:dTDP-4-amino-4,6-dideoxygalactose transaminase
MIPHSRPTISAADQQAVLRVLESGQVAGGPAVREFEQALAAYLGLADGVAVSSGSCAIEVALLAMGVGPGDEVILPSYICSGPWLAVRRVGAVPRVVDIGEDYALDPEMVRKAITGKTRAILAAHMFGLPTDVGRLAELGVPVIEDCAQTLGAAVRGRAVGSQGVLAICSFYATKLLCAGEGGMLLSRDEALLTRARGLRDYDETGHLDERAFNRKLTDLQAALGLAQLKQLPGFIQRRSATAAAYHRALKGCGLGLPLPPEDRTHVYFRYVVRLPADKNVEGFLDSVGAAGVCCRRPVFRPLHRYLGSRDCPSTDLVFDTAVSIPIYPSLGDAEISYVTETICRQLH